MNLDNAERFWTLLIAVAGAFTAVLRFMWLARGKWDETNNTLRGLIRTVTVALEQNERDHARMDRHIDSVEGRINEHIGRHRRY